MATNEAPLFYRPENAPVSPTTPTITPGQNAALLILREASPIRFDVYDLAGPANSTTRQRLFSLWMGTDLPKSQCGVNAIRDALFSHFRIMGTCGADRDTNFARTMRRLMEGGDGRG